MSQLALALRDVDYAYPGREPTLRHVTLAVPRSCATVILGPNGSGKTTLMRIAAGLVAPHHGAATLEDGTSTRAGMRAGRIGYIPQHLGLVRSASVLDNALAGGLSRASALRSALGLVPSALRDEAYAALDAVGLSEKADAPVKRLSGGERQRVAIARTLVQRPELVVADELIASLDALQSHAVMELLRVMKRRGVALLLSLHQIDVALSNADQVCFLKRGSLTNPRSPLGMTPEEARWALTA